MDLAAGQPARLRDLLGALAEDQLILLARRFAIAAAELRDTRGFRSAPEREDELARWVVARGRRAWLSAKAAPETLPLEPPPDADFGPVFEAVYRARFGGALPAIEPEPADWQTFTPDAVWEGHLWQLLEVVALGVPLAQAVETYTRRELVYLARTIRELGDRMQVTLETALGVDDPIAGDWGLHGSWIVGLGRADYERIAAKPETVPRTLPDDLTLLWDDLEEVYTHRYRARWPMVEHA
jgi:hypothetical protein